MSIKENYHVRCSRCKNEHTIKDRVEIPFSKKRTDLMVSTCPRCGGREYIAQTQQSETKPSN